MKQLVWLVPVLPFLGALVNGVVLRNRLCKRGVTNVACGSVLLSLLVGMGAIGSYLGSAEYAAGEAFKRVVYGWIPAGLQGLGDGRFAELSFEMGFLLDPLSAVMIFVVTFVGFLIHVYSVGYMGHEEGYQRFFVYMNLFMG
ncbi:MAG: NADH-quinone oxidoreductase subunit L, partial [Xanthomonadales bacterium]|nr:NADH-quinone oxidoreductase subunit L [Xanthomonadales bacterium]NIT33341.1 NADH-quinone oxidoreductase subunit L [Xanthomonadales bacterium]